MIVPMCSQRCIYNKYARKKAKRQKAMPQRCKRCICKVRWYSASEERASVVPHCGGRGGDDFRCLISNALPHPCLALHWGGGWRNCFLFCWVGIGATFNCTVLKTRSFLKHTLYMCSQSWRHIWVESGWNLGARTPSVGSHTSKMATKVGVETNLAWIWIRAKNVPADLNF